MATQEYAHESEAAILSRLFGGGHGPLFSEELARYILGVGFSDRDKARMSELARRNQDDELTTGEKEELLAFVRAGDLLSILKSKARRTVGVGLESRPVS